MSQIVLVSMHVCYPVGLSTSESAEMYLLLLESQGQSGDGCAGAIHCKATGYSKLIWLQFLLVLIRVQPGVAGTCC